MGMEALLSMADHLAEAILKLRLLPLEICKCLRGWRSRSSRSKVIPIHAGYRAILDSFVLLILSLFSVMM